MNSTPADSVFGHNYHIVPELPRDQSPKPTKGLQQDAGFLPKRPSELSETKLSENDLHPLILKFLYALGDKTGSEIANQLRLPFSMVEPLLSELRSRMLIAYRGSAMGGDYIYELQPQGLALAQNFYNVCTYCGAAPVDFDTYFESVYAQSLAHDRPNASRVNNAMGDLLLNPSTCAQIGQAVRSGKSMLLYGAPGNGKTSIAERVIHSVDACIWIPRTLTISGSIIRLFDATVHEEAPLPESEGLLRNEIDDRWVRIKRPAVIVGGELEMDHLEATLNPTSGIIEAPIHLKSNCGCLVVDDFGRQKISVEELLNRWIVPLESNQDYIKLPTGRQIQVPFEQLLVFSTNLKPKSLCDEAFLRRIHYKIEVFDPSREQFERLWYQVAEKMGVKTDAKAFEHLITEHYEKGNRALRFCHVSDLLDQVKHFCEYQECEIAATPETIDIAISNYFARH